MSVTPTQTLFLPLLKLLTKTKAYFPPWANKLFFFFFLICILWLFWIFSSNMGIYREKRKKKKSIQLFNLGRGGGNLVSIL